MNDIEKRINKMLKKSEVILNAGKQTNEQWFTSLSTEEKAKWLSQRSQILYDCGQRDVFPKIMYEEDWEMWLKQPHTKGVKQNEQKSVGVDSQDNQSICGM